VESIASPIYDLNPVLPVTESAGPKPTGLTGSLDTAKPTGGIGFEVLDITASKSMESPDGGSDYLNRPTPDNGWKQENHFG
jgi:hypothetical protein